MANVQDRLAALKTKIDQGKTERAKAEANLATYTKQRDEILAELATLGVTPENLEAEIARLSQEIEADLARAEELLAG